MRAAASISTDKLQVRQRTPALTATRLKAAQRVQLTGSGSVDLNGGDWVISRGASIIDWVRGSLAEKYEPLTEPGLTLPPSVLVRIEQTTGFGSVKDPYVLLDAIERLAAISIGTIQIDFTPGQLEEITHRAGKRGRTVEQELRAAVDRVKDEIFHRGA